ncbi:MAG: periplasmic heavy metal sensor [Bacteroidetes bacterium]|nr:periplasmic heavy metal sensor [Bacteroidota bacterium]
MSRERLLAIAVIGLLLINVCTVGFFFFAKPPHLPGGPPPFGGMEPKNQIVESLHFDQQQIVEYEKLIAQHRQTIRELNDRIHEAKSLLYQSLSNENGTVKDSLINTLGSLQRQIETTHYNHFRDIKAICKPEQLAYFETLSEHLANFFNADKQRPGRPE